MNTKIAFALAAAALLSACDGAKSTGNGSTAAASSVGAAPISVGKPAVAEGVTLTVTSVAERSQLGLAAAGMKAEPGETYVVVRYTLKNTGKAPLGFTDRPSLTLVDAKGGSLSPDDTAGPMAASGMQELSGMANDVNPGVAAKAVAVWKVSKAAFDRATWRLVASTTPQLAFSLK